MRPKASRRAQSSALPEARLPVPQRAAPEAQAGRVAPSSMPIDKRDLQDEGDTLTLTKAAWMIAIAVIVTIFAAFVLGIFVHYVVEFFERGWNLVR